MIAVIFEFTPADGRFTDYKKLAEGLGEDVARIHGFVSIERFQSISDPGRFVSLSFWRDEESVRRWRNLQQHREARRGAAACSALTGCACARCCATTGMEKRGEAPRDSVAAHG